MENVNNWLLWVESVSKQARGEMGVIEKKGGSRGHDDFARSALVTQKCVPSKYGYK